MITNFKIFENSATEYAKFAKKGDILVCIIEPNEHDGKKMNSELRIGYKYEILSIDVPRPDDVQYYYFNLRNLKTQEIITGYGAILFKPESDFDANKFNL